MTRVHTEITRASSEAEEVGLEKMEGKSNQPSDEARHILEPRLRAGSDMKSCEVPEGHSSSALRANGSRAEPEGLRS